MDQSIRFCRTSDGVNLAYAVSGQGTPLVMPATWLTHLEHQWKSLAWQPWLKAFSKNHKVLRYDTRGCGLSDREADFSFNNWMRDLECVIDAAGFSHFDLLGTCWAGPLAIEYAARHPERVRGLVLYGTFALGRLRWNDRPEEAEKARLMLDLTRLGWGQDDHPFAKVWASHFQPGGTLDHVRSWCFMQRVATSPQTAVRLLQIGWTVDVRDAAKKIKCPVLVLHREEDALVPIDQGRMIAALIPNSRFVQIDGNNHMPLADEPAWRHIVSEIEAFLQKPVEDTARETLPLHELTPQERKILEGIAGGFDNDEIAHLLGISEKTVRNNITRIFDKIGVEHRYQAIVRARDAGLGRGLNSANSR
jgi:pimeloyl-ACP methyl ester carboxylesterase/DNA-binding CsgD family transcriptional regulator